jgi:ribonuclease P protein component
MLPKRLRLNSRWLFQKTLQEGRCLYRSSFFTWIGLNHWKTQTTKQMVTPSVGYAPKIGFIVSKKVDKRAAVRNRLKRRIRECLRQEILPALTQEQVSRFATWVFIAKPTPTRPSYGQLRAAIIEGVRFLTPKSYPQKVAKADVQTPPQQACTTE